MILINKRRVCSRAIHCASFCESTPNKRLVFVGSEFQLATLPRNGKKRGN